MMIPLKMACLCVDLFFRGSLIPQKSILGEQDGEQNEQALANRNSAREMANTLVAR